MIESFVVILVSILFGYFFGYLNASKKDIKEFVDETGQVIRIEAMKLITPAIPTGRIRPKTALDMHKQAMDPKRREGLEADKIQMDSVPELVQAKELAQAMKKEEYGG